MHPRASLSGVPQMRRMRMVHLQIRRFRMVHLRIHRLLMVSMGLLQTFLMPTLLLLTLRLSIHNMDHLLARLMAHLMAIHRALHNHMDRLEIHHTAAQLLIMAPKDILSSTAHRQITSRVLHNMASLQHHMPHQMVSPKGLLNMHRNAILPSEMDPQSLARTAVLNKVALFSMDLLKMSPIMGTRTLSNNMVAMALKVLMEMVRKRMHLIPTVLLFSLPMVTFLHVRILAMSVRADRTATGLAQLNLSSKTVLRILLNQLPRVIPINHLQDSVCLKMKIDRHSSRSVGTAANRAVLIRPTVMEQIVLQNQAIVH